MPLRILASRVATAARAAMHGEIVFVGRGEIVSRPEETLAIQFREFERPKKGGRMQLKESKTITLHDVSLKEIYDKLLAVLKEAEER